MKLSRLPQEFKPIIAATFPEYRDGKAFVDYYCDTCVERDGMLVKERQ